MPVATATTKRATLRSVPSSAPLKIAGDTIEAVALAHANIEAKGHGFEMDTKSLQQAADIINQKGGVPCRITHPVGSADGVLSLIGTVDNARVIDGVLRGDLHLGSYAAGVPGLGNIKTYILKLAAENPRALGMSMVIDYHPVPRAGALPVARIADVSFADVVGQGAVTPHGLLSQKRLSMPLTPEMKQRLIDEYGLDPAADDATAQAFYDALSPEEKSALSKAPAAAMSAAQLDSAELEIKRVGNLQKLGTMLKIKPEVVNAAIAAGETIETARTRYLKAIETGCPDVSNVWVGEDINRVSLTAAVGQAVALKCGRKIEKKHPRTEQFTGMHTLEIARRYYEALGIDMTGVSRTQLAKMCVSRNHAPDRVQRALLGQSTSNFDYVLTTNFSATLRRGYDEGPVKWPLFAKRGILPDMQSGDRPILSSIKTPALTLEGGEYQQFTVLDKKETIQLAKYTNLLRLTWEIVVNDRLGAFSSVFERMGGACRRLEDSVAFNPLTTASGVGQTMTEDTTALFHTNHSNIVTVTVGLGAPSVATLNAARTLLSKQVGLNSETLNLDPAVILVPVELATTTEILVASMVNPAGTNAQPNAEFIRNLVVVSNARLSTVSTTAWILAASPDAIDGVEVAFLEDEPEPVMEFQQDFVTDDQMYKVRHCVAGRALDYRGFVRNPGA